MASTHTCGPPDGLMQPPCPIRSPMGVWSIPQTFLRYQHRDSPIPPSQHHPLCASGGIQHTGGFPSSAPCQPQPKNGQTGLEHRCSQVDGGPPGRQQRTRGLSLRAANSWAHGDAGLESEGQVLGRPTKGVGKEGPKKDASRAGCWAVSVRRPRMKLWATTTSPSAQDP